MYLTKDILKERHACGEGYFSFLHKYPDGAELTTLIKDEDINLHYLHWGRTNLDVSAEEICAYEESCKIIGSDGVYESDNINNCNFVSKSSKVSDSREIFNCKNIKHCKRMFGTSMSENSDRISESSFVYKSSEVIKGRNITSSDHIVNSTFIINCTGVRDSQELENSTCSYSCIKCKDVHFSSKLVNCSHCLFCYDLKDEEYCIFNRKVSASVFEVVAAQYASMMQPMQFMEDWNNAELSMFEVPRVYYRYDAYFSNYEPEFYEWAKSLPNYDYMLIYNICFNPDCLENK